MLIDCGPHGILNCGHAHADALAIEVVACGKTMVVDPGTFTYTASVDLRNHFRSSLAHSAVSIDGESSSLPGGPFTWRTIARAVAHRWHVDDAFDFFEGSHDGFGRLTDPVGYTRQVLFIKGDYWIVRDTVRARGAHLVSVTFQTSAGTTVTALSSRAVRVCAADDVPATLDIVSLGTRGEFRVREAWTSQVYGTRTPAANCAFVAPTSGSESITTCLIPHAGQDRRWQVMDGNDASRVEILGTSAADCVAFDVRENDGRFNDVGLRGDADVLWMRSSRPDGYPTRCVAIGVRALWLGSQALVPPSEFAPWIVAERRGAEWVVRCPVLSA